MTPLDDPAPHARLLSNGRYGVLLTGAGGGRSSWEGLALTAWSGDRTEDADGIFVYLRDLERGTFWSLGHQPVRHPGERYAASSEPGRVTIARLDDGIEATLDVAVDPDGDRELRRVRLRNHSAGRRRIELTTYAEIVLADPAAHAAHPAFSKLFVQTELEDGILLARRRPRSAGERTPWMVHALHGPGSLAHETDRARFLGRGRSAARPVAATRPLSGTTGSVLDPVFALRRAVELAPGGEATLALVVAAAETRTAALALARAPASVDDVLGRAAAAERALCARHGLSPARGELLQELAGRVLYGAVPADADAIRRARGLSAVDLQRLGLSGRRPLLLAETDDAAREALEAQAYWRAKGLEVEVLVLGVAAGGGEGVVVRPGPLPAEDDALVRALAVRPFGDQRPVPRGPAAPPRPSAPGADGVDRAEEPLLFWNGHGGFAPDGSEYVIRVGRSSRPPMPWVNVVANERFGFLASEAGAGYTWSRNSREHRLTPWSNDPVADPLGEALYVRDEETGVSWSPVSASAACEVRHGFGYSRWRQTSQDLEHDVCLFVPRRDPVKLARVRLTNRGARPRRLALFSYARLVLGGLPSRTVVTAFDAATQAVLAENPLDADFADGIVFAAAVGNAAAPVRFTTDRTAFLGRNGSAEHPAALADPALDGATGAGLDPCAALQVAAVVEPGATWESTFLLGEVTDPADLRAIVARYREPDAVARALEEVRAFWRETLGTVQVETPSPAIDVLVNGWLTYQNVACRLWGRSAFYQSGGAFGFRDQLQDAAALVYARPDLTRAQILLHAAHQFVEGDVLHWWHPPSGRGTRTRFSDDLLWLPYVTAFYVRTTGDETVLDERAGFVTARALAPGEDETYLLPSPAAESASVYDHCCRALDRSLTRGAHGLPLMGTGDWNDGMNRVGREGRGESVWLGFFLYRVLGDFLPLCERRGDEARARRYRDYVAALRVALEDAGWDGAWYRRAYYDDGTPLGSAASDECRIDALAQAWAVISGAAPRERAERAMEAVERELVDERAGLVRLLAPPFDRTAHDPGYIKGYVPGIRENGGQYTHAALWVVRALAELGRRERAAKLLEMLGPVHHASSPDAVAVYQVEPYVVAADLYGVAPHLGRGGWTWYTGSAGWMFRVALESVLGVTVEGGETLRVRPCIPDGWRGYTVRLRLPDGTRYEIAVANPDGNAQAVTACEPGAVEDGAARVPVVRDGGLHRVAVTLGAPATGRPRRTGAPGRGRAAR